MSESVDVLLATYQGAEYLDEQLASILTQTHPQLHIWIRDDGSTDHTNLILKKWVQTYPEKISLLPSNDHLGIKGNFSELMKYSQAPYVMFADQDDRWFPLKIEWSLNQLKIMEQHNGSQIPLLVHTDLKVVNRDLKEISPSFWQYTGLHPRQTSLNRLLTQNVLTGCTMLMNRALVDRAVPIPEEAIVHDWWVALVCSCFGHIQFLNQPTLYYRQHNHNDTGAKSYCIRHFFRQSPQERKKINHCTHQTYRQARCLLHRYNSSLSAEKQTLIQAYGEIERLSFLKQKRQMLKYQFFKQGFLRNVKAFILDS